jgi:sialate O-acetylesterase
LIYGQTASASGPTVHAARLQAGQIRVGFDDVEDHLVAYGTPRPISFQLCGDSADDCRFVDAELLGNEVLLAADRPATRVRFCWGDAPVCNLYDKSGLPAGPFEIAIEGPQR